MANIRIDVDYTIKDGTELVFRSPCDCTEITGLIVYYATEDGTASMEFALADAHGENVGDIPHLFVGNVVVKVILDIASGMAFVQNADTNAYLEAQLASKAPIGHTHDAADVDAAPASHATNKSNPHGVTAAQVGAAPAGYGLGGFAVSVPGNNLDTLKANGWYYCADSTTGGPSGYALGNAVVEVSVGSAYSTVVHQTLHFGTAGRQPFTIKRYWNNATNAWVDWEWITPPMLAGGEYRTTERYKGKAVYTKLINFGYLPNATHSGIANGVNATLVIRCEGVTSNGYTLPYNYNGSLIDLCAEKGWILITTNKDYSTATADVQIWYTKD